MARAEMTTPSLAEMLATLTTSLESASDVVPNEASVTPPTDGLSLLDVKNDLLLSYLQHLTFLLLLKLRGLRKASAYLDTSKSPDLQPHPAEGVLDTRHGVNGAEENGAEEDSADLQESTVRQLVEARLYLEKGVKPLENRLQYQLDKVLRAADDAARATTQTKTHKPGGNRASKNRRPKTDSGARVHRDSGASEDASSAEDPDARDSNTSDDASDAQAISDLAYRPNPSAFQRPQSRSTAPSGKPGRRTTTTTTDVYRPPRITPIAPPDTRPSQQRRAARPHKSATLDEFVATELSGAPTAEPSIGSTIVRGGRGVRTARERAAEAARREYEEGNLVRLPREGKKERKRQARGAEAGWGGEEWRELGGGLDRIARLTRREGGGGGALDRSRKRKVGEGGGGLEMGEAWERRKRAHRKKG